MAGNRNSGMCSPLCSDVCEFYLPPRSYTGIPHRYHFSLRRNIIVRILPFLVSLTEKGDLRSVCN